MKTIQIEVSEDSLQKLNNAGISYVITNADVDIEDLLTAYTDVSELSNYELSQIVSTAHEAIEQGTEYGIAIDTLSGRDMNDRRCYTLSSVSVVSRKDDNCRHTVSELLNHKQ